MVIIRIGGYFCLSPLQLNSDSSMKKLLYSKYTYNSRRYVFSKEKNLFIKERRSIRIAFANSTSEEINDLFKRLKFSF